jgi:hypothetical protein
MDTTVLYHSTPHSGPILRGYKTCTIQHPPLAPLSILTCLLLVCIYRWLLLLSISFLTTDTCFTQYPLYTVMVFDEWQNGIPVAFIITSKCAKEDILLWLTKLRDRVVQHQ